MDAIIKIQKMLDLIGPDDKNNIDDIYLNVIHNEFIKFHGHVEIPKIPVKELDYTTAIDIVEKIIEYIPEFLCGYHLLKKRKPESEQYSLHFIDILKGRYIYFTHIFKIDSKFSGDASNVIEKGDSNNFPSYKTDRIYYKSRLIPQNSVLKQEDIVIDFSPIRLKDTQEVQSDEYFHTFAIFDELNVRELSKKLCQEIDPDIYNISLDLYPFVVFDFFTACFNVVCPNKKELAEALELFEPIYIFLYSKYRKYEEIISVEVIKDLFKDELNVNNGNITLKDEFLQKLKVYFLRFSFIRDDELSLKGWWKFNFN